MPDRRTLPVAAVAHLLEVTPTRVRQRLDDHLDPLDGPQTRGRGHAREVWADTVGARATLSQASGSPSTGEVVGRLAMAQAQLAEMTTALHHVNFAAEKMREALEEQDKAFRLMERANKAQRRALRRMQEAELARQEAMAPFTVEEPPSSEASGAS